MKYPLKKLIANFIESEGFSRLDLVPRYMAIEDHFGKYNGGWDIYLKMMLVIEKDKRTSEQQKENFINLIENDHFDLQKHPLVLKSDTWRLADGAHRLSCAWYFGHENVFLEYKPLVKHHIFVGIEWFEKWDFTRAEIGRIVDKKDELLGEMGVI